MKNQQKIRKLVLTAILSAIIVVLAFLPIRFGVIEITLTIIPLAVGCVVGGPYVGLTLGFVFGITSFLQCFGYSPFGVEILGINPWYAFLVCVPTRMLAGFIPSLLNSLLKKKEKIDTLRSILICLLVPLLNTIFFMTTLVLLFYKTEYIQGFVNATNAPNPFVFVIYFVGINGLVELLAGAVVSFPIVRALKKAFD